eukprot:scaffold36880_cov161-Skeletonema_marinoi.AAC.1
MFLEKKKNARSESLDETDGKKLKKHGRKVDELNREIDALVKQIHEHYCSFMGNDRPSGPRIDCVKRNSGVPE